MNNLSYICMGLVVLFHLNVANANLLDASDLESKASTNDFVSMLLDDPTFNLVVTNNTDQDQIAILMLSTGTQLDIPIGPHSSSTTEINGPSDLTVTVISGDVGASLTQIGGGGGGGGGVPESGSLLPIFCALVGLMGWLKSKSEPRAA